MEKSEAARQEEQQRKALETKTAAFEKQVLQLQVSQGSRHVGAPFTPPTKPLCRAGTEQSLLGHLGSSLPAKILTAGHVGLLGLEPSAWTSLVTVMDSSRGMGAFSVVSIVLSALQTLTQLILIVTQSGGCCYCL